MMNLAKSSSVDLVRKLLLYLQQCGLSGIVYAWISTHVLNLVVSNVTIVLFKCKTECNKMFALYSVQVGSCASVVQSVNPQVTAGSSVHAETVSVMIQVETF